MLKLALRLVGAMLVLAAGDHLLLLSGEGEEVRGEGCGMEGCCWFWRTIRELTWLVGWKLGPWGCFGAIGGEEEGGAHLQ